MLELLPPLLKRLRMEAGFTREEMAAVLGISTSEISCYESGECLPTYQLLETIVFAFEPPISELHSLPTALCAFADCLVDEEQVLGRDYLEALDRAVDRAISNVSDLHRPDNYPILASAPHQFPLNDP